LFEFSASSGSAVNLILLTDVVRYRQRHDFLRIDKRVRSGRYRNAVQFAQKATGLLPQVNCAVDAQTIE
jgi:hypothetical protein